MTIADFERVLDHTCPTVKIIDWAVALRATALQFNGLGPFSEIAGMLSEIIEEFPTCCRLRLCDTIIPQKILQKIIARR